MKHIRILLFICSVMILQYRAAAQSSGAVEQVMQEMKQLQSFYKDQSLSFGMKFTYAEEKEPAKVLDSLSGQMEMAGANYRYRLDSTEVIRNNKYTIILFNDSKLMCLARPDTMIAGGDPVAQMQQVMQKTGIESCEVLHNGKYKTLRVLFSKTVPYRQMEITIDTVSGYLLKSRYIIKSALLMENVSGEEAAAAGYDSYAIVQVEFENYRKVKPDPTRFSERTFFYKDGTAFKTADAYSNYQLFLGTPNL